MICPVCSGRGHVRKRFLWFFRWRWRCSNCHGVGRLEADGSKVPRPVAAAYGDRRDSFRDWADDQSAMSSRDGANARDETFVVGGGGRSGGGGGGATWGDDPVAREASPRGAEPPLIVDPFVTGGAPVVASDAGSAEVASDRSDDGGSDAGSDLSSNGGTSY